MKNKFLIFSLFFLLFLVSCNNNEMLPEESDYPKIEDIDYTNMEMYESVIVIDNISYDYTFYFENDACMGAKVMIEFNNEKEANEFYSNKKQSELYKDINIENNIITYYYNIENFEYALYPKEKIIEFINDNKFIAE